MNEIQKQGILAIFRHPSVERLKCQQGQLSVTRRTKSRVRSQNTEVDRRIQLSSSKPDPEISKNHKTIPLSS